MTYIAKDLVKSR